MPTKRQTMPTKKGHDAVKSLVSQSKKNTEFQRTKGTTKEKYASTKDEEADHKKALAAKKSPYQAIVKDKYLQVTIDGHPFALDSTHPTFARLKKALQAKDWKAVPKLVSIAKSLFDASKGNVVIKGGVCYYKGTKVDDSLTQRMVDMIKDKKEVTHMLLFMDDLYQNPEPLAIAEFFDWLRHNDLPITDDGCFMAYKSVDSNFKDQHTHKIDNSPGQVIWMPRAAADTNYRTQCSYGFHICSKQYGLYGTHVMAVKARPRDVLSAEGGKIRVLRYEVIKQLGVKEDMHFREEGFSALEKQLVVEIRAERKELLGMLLASAPIKRMIRSKKISKTSFLKTSYARLKSMALKYEVVPQPVQETKEVIPPLQAARKAAGLSVGQVAKESGMSYKVVATLEKNLDPHPDKADAILAAIGSLKGLHLSTSAISYPVATQG